VGERLATVKQELATVNASIPGAQRRLAAHKLAEARGAHNEATELHLHIVVLENEINGLEQLSAQAEYREIVQANEANERDIAALWEEKKHCSNALSYTGRDEHEIQTDIFQKRSDAEKRYARQNELLNAFPDALAEINTH
jgi:hypothetical protein